MHRRRYLRSQNGIGVNAVDRCTYAERELRRMNVSKKWFA